MVRTICQQHTTLSSPAIAHLEAIAQQLPLMAELNASDVFIDCFSPAGVAIVVAHAPRTNGKSLYQRDVVGQQALAEKEPAVYRAAHSHSPVRDIKALTQEGRVVRQDVVPIFFENQGCVGVLIREKDISHALQQERKLEALSKAHQAQDASVRGHSSSQEALLLREMHHRVKNNLQLLASMLNLKARRCGDGTSRKILEESVGRVLSIASIHDILNQTPQQHPYIDSLTLLQTLCSNLQSLIPDDNSVVFHVSGDAVALNTEVASAVALVVNELITNAITHAFVGRDTGRVDIVFTESALCYTVTVTDNGIGFSPRTLPGKNNGIGLQIVEATIHDRLQGQFCIHATDQGSKLSFHCKKE